MTMRPCAPGCGPSNVQAAGGKIDVLDAGADEFRPAQAGLGQDDNDVALIAARGSKCLALVRGEVAVTFSFGNAPAETPMAGLRRMRPSGGPRRGSKARAGALTPSPTVHRQGIDERLDGRTGFSPTLRVARSRRPASRPGTAMYGQGEDRIDAR